MNPFKKFKYWIIGDTIAKTDDVFEKAKIHLTYNFSFFFIILGLIFYGNIFANNLWWQFYITTIGVIMLPFNFVFLKKGNFRYAAYWFVTQQLILSSANLWLYHFELNIIGGFWVMVFLLFTFFVLGKTWGFAITAVVVLQSLVAVIDKASGNIFLNYHIPPEQIPEQLPIFVLVPLSICVYTIYQIVDTRGNAETKINEQKLQLLRNNDELKHQKGEILSSINYAKKIQQAVLPALETVSRNIPQSFILYKPKDIVSGDFYWFYEIDKDNYIVVCADCTGHGVPGAFMTVIGSNLLNQTVIDNKIYQPKDILVEVNRLLNSTLKQDKEKTGVQDGMDLSLLKVNKTTKELIITSAKRPVVFIRDNQLQEIKGNKSSIGGMREGDKKFEEVKINYKENDQFYFFTDGYHDQFGGDKGKKFSTKRLREALLEIHGLPIAVQKQKLDTIITDWMGNLEQVDDILVMGIKL